MSRIVYVNGRYLPYAHAAVHVEDRGFQLADAVYEVCEVKAGAIIDETRHLDRLWRSLGELRMPPPMSRRALQLVIARTLRVNRVHDGSVYLQVTRGVARRDFQFPPPDVPASLVVIARSRDPAKATVQAQAGIAVVTRPDLRWRRCDIKTVMLLPACLAKEDAHAAGAKEAWLVDADGNVTEGASSNAWIVDADGRLITRQLDAAILPGVTRRTLLDAIKAEGLVVVERSFSVAEAKAAAEAFITSASNTVMPVISIDGKPVGQGRPGLISQRLRSRFHRNAEKTPFTIFGMHPSE